MAICMSEVNVSLKNVLMNVLRGLIPLNLMDKHILVNGTVAKIKIIVTMLLEIRKLVDTYLSFCVAYYYTFISALERNFYFINYKIIMLFL